MSGCNWNVSVNEVFPAIERWMLRDGFDIVIDMEKSQGSTIVDARTGDQWLDFYTFFASAPFGMNHPKLANEEFKEKIFRAAINKVANSDIYTREMGEFVKTFGEVAIPAPFKHLFFVDYGSLAVENALKVAMDWKVRRLLAAGKITRGEAYNGARGTKILHFNEAFHGRSGYTLSLTNTNDPNKHQMFAKFTDWPRVVNPKITWPLEKHLGEVQWLERLAINQIERAMANNPDDICAIILETIQGEGGDNHFRTEFLQALRQICDAHDMLLIFDEVQCGMGITGKMWAFEHHGVAPDIFSFGKKTQICGLAAGPRVDQEPQNCFTVSSRINSTWGGTIADMVRSTRYLEIYRDEHILDQVSNVTGPRLMQGLKELEAEFPQFISNVRGKGLMCAYDFPCEELRNKFKMGCWEQKMLILPCGNVSMRYRPALNVPVEVIDRSMEISRSVLKKMC